MVIYMQILVIFLVTNQPFCTSESFTEEFRKKALSLGISLDSPEEVTKYNGSLHSYIRHSLLMIEPTTIDSTSVKAIHLENRGKNDKYDHSKKPPFKPSNVKFKGKGKEDDINEER